MKVIRVHLILVFWCSVHGPTFVGHHQDKGYEIDKWWRTEGLCEGENCCRMVFFSKPTSWYTTFWQFYHARLGVREVAQASTRSKPHADPQRERKCVCVCATSSSADLFCSPFLTCARRNKTVDVWRRYRECGLELPRFRRG